MPRERRTHKVVASPRGLLRILFYRRNGLRLYPSNGRWHYC